jgi:predicted Zn-dependent protease
MSTCLATSWACLPSAWKKISGTRTLHWSAASLTLAQPHDLFFPTSSYEQAERRAKAALAINPRDTWSIHALAHVHEMQGKQEEGINFLTEEMANWKVLFNEREGHKMLTRALSNSGALDWRVTYGGT